MLHHMGFYATDTLETAPPAITGTCRARQHPLCGQKPLRGPILNAISGYRFYNPELGRWINRDPIEEMGGRYNSRCGRGSYVGAPDDDNFCRYGHSPDDNLCLPLVPESGAEIERVP